MKFKHGEKVTCEIEGTKITDAKISIKGSGIPFICQNEKDGTITPCKLGYKYSWMLAEDFTNSDVENLKSVIKTFDNLEVGDEYKDSDGSSRFVLGVCGRVIFLSAYDNKDFASFYSTKEKLIENGCTIVQDTEEDTEDSEEVKKAIKTLEEAGKLVDGKIIK